MLQLHIVYKLEHEDIDPLFQVCQELRSMVSFVLLDSWSACIGANTTWLMQMHTAMMLHFTFVTPHRQIEETYAHRNMVKQHPALRAQPASSSTNRYAIKNHLLAGELQCTAATA